MATIASKLTSTGTLFISGEFDEITTSTIRLTKSNQFASSFDEVSLSAGSILFDGTNDYLSMTATTALSFGTGNFTVEARIKPTALVFDKNSIAAGLGPTNGDWMLALRSSTQLSWGRNQIAWDAETSGVTFATNTWYHVAVSRSAGNLQIFVDGISRYSAANSISYDIGNTFLAVGARQLSPGVFGPGEYFSGYISDLKITKGVGLYTSNFTPSQSVLDATTTTSLLLNCLTSSTFITDNSSSRFAITNNNGATFSTEGAFNRGVTTVKRRQLPTGQLQVAGLFDEYELSIVTSGLVLYLDATNSSSYPGSGTTWTDLSGNSNTGTLTNGPTYTDTDYGAIVFDGTNDYVNIPTSTSINSPLASDFSYDIWVYPQVTAYSYPKIFAKGKFGSVQNNLVLGMNLTTTPKSMNVELMVSGTAVYPLSMNFEPLQWYNIVITRSISLNTMSMYVNSALTTSSTISSISADFSNTNPLRIGSSSEGAAAEFSSQKVGLFKFYNRALTAAEVAKNFNATRIRYSR